MLLFSSSDRRLNMRYLAMALTAAIAFLFAGVVAQNTQATPLKNALAFDQIEQSLIEQVGCPLEPGDQPEPGPPEFTCPKNQMLVCENPRGFGPSGDQAPEPRHIACGCEPCDELEASSDKDELGCPCRRNTCCTYKPGRRCCR